MHEIKSFLWQGRRITKDDMSARLFVDERGNVLEVLGGNVMLVNNSRFVESVEFLAPQPAADFGIDIKQEQPEPEPEQKQAMMLTGCMDAACPQQETCERFAPHPAAGSCFTQITDSMRVELPLEKSICAYYVEKVVVS